MKNNKSKIILLVFLLTLAMSVQAFAVPTIKTTDDILLTEEQINERIEEINSKYEIGEAFSEEDANFIKEYANVNYEKLLTSNDQVKSDEVVFEPDSFLLPGGSTRIDFDADDSGGGVDVNCAGYIFFNLGVINHSYGGDFTTTVTAGANLVNKIEHEIKCTSYGLLGSEGAIGKVYEGTINNETTTSTVWTIDETEYFTAVVLYSNIVAKSIITHDTGSFTID